MPIRKLTTTIITASALGGLMGAALAGTAGAAAPSAPTSAAFSFTATGATGAGSGTITGHGQADFADAAASLTVDIPAGALGSSGLAASALSGGGEVEVIVAGGTVYVGGPLVSSFTQGKLWVSVPLSSLDHGTSTSSAIGKLAADLGDVGSLVSSAKADGATVSTLGAGTVDGTAATGYVVTVKGHHASASSSGPGVPVTLWADSQGRLVQASTTVSAKGGADHGSVVVDLSGYNAPISIAAPDAATVLPLPAGLLKGALGASGLKGVLGTTTSFLGFDPAKRTAAHRAKA